MSSYGYGGRGRGDRWDTERFEIERDRNRYGTETRERFEERDSRFSRRGGFGPARPRDRSVDEVYERERFGPRGYEDERSMTKSHDMQGKDHLEGIGEQASR